MDRSADNIGNIINNLQRDMEELKSTQLTSDSIADGSITAQKLNWGTFYAQIVYAGSNFTTDSSTMTDKFQIEHLPKGRYLFLASTNWYAANTGADGECNMRFSLVDGGETTNSDTNIAYLDNTAWSGTTNTYSVIWSVNNDDSTIKVQTSVDHPDRGTFRCFSTSFLIAVRVGELF